MKARRHCGRPAPSTPSHWVTFRNPDSTGTIRDAKSVTSETGVIRSLAARIPSDKSRSGLTAHDLHLRTLPLLPRNHGRQKPDFGLHLGGIGHSVRDFLTKKFAISLA